MRLFVHATLFFSTLCLTSDAHAFRILFYDVRPAAKLLDLPNLDGSRTIAPKDFEKLSVMDLLEYDLIYVDMQASDLQHLSAHQKVLNEAVDQGVGLYLQGDIAAYAASPVDAPSTRAVDLRGFDLPNAAYLHPMATDAELMPDDFGDAYAAKARGFTSVPDGFSVIAEAESKSGARFPVLLAGQFGGGRVVLRTHEFTDQNADGIEKIDAAIIAWLSSRTTEPRPEPLAWIVDNHPRKMVVVNGPEATPKEEITLLRYTASERARRPLARALPLPTLIDTQAN